VKIVMRAAFPVSLRNPKVLLGFVGLSGFFLVLASCGGGPVSKKPTVNMNVNSAITEVAEAARHPEAFSRMFADGATVPEADREKYTGYIFFSYSMDVSGNNATAQVTVRDNNGKEVGKVEWTLELQNEVWKLKTAPLP
jgi:hypothetical protein